MRFAHPDHRCIRYGRKGHGRDPETYSAVRNGMVDEPTLKGLDKWIMLYLLTHSDNWEPQVCDIANHCLDGESAIRSAMKRLRSAQYLQSIKVINNAGEILRWTTLYSDRPVNWFSAKVMTVKEKDLENVVSGESHPDSENHQVESGQGIGDLTSGDSPDGGFPDVGYPDVGHPDVGNHQHTNKDLTNEEFTNKEFTIPPYPPEGEPQKTPEAETSSEEVSNVGEVGDNSTTVSSFSMDSDTLEMSSSRTFVSAAPESQKQPDKSKYKKKLTSEEFMTCVAATYNQSKPKKWAACLRCNANRLRLAQRLYEDSAYDLTAVVRTIQVALSQASKDPFWSGIQGAVETLFRERRYQALVEQAETPDTEDATFAETDIDLLWDWMKQRFGAGTSRADALAYITKRAEPSHPEHQVMVARLQELRTKAQPKTQQSYEVLEIDSSSPEYMQMLSTRGER